MLCMRQPLRPGLLLGLHVLLLVSSAPSVASKTHETMLDNGMKIVIREDHRAPVVVSQLWYRVGATYEPPGLTGVSHVLEHMMFKGTRNLGPGEFSEIIARFGGTQNAFTSADYTGYYQVLAANHLELSLQLESERMQNLLLDEDELRKELEVIKEERRMRVDDRPSGQFMERFRATAHVASSYQQPVIGWMHDLNTMTMQAIRDWYQRWYAPNNATLVVVGDVQPEQVVELARKYFGGFSPSSLPQVVPPREIPAPGLRRMQVELRAELPTLTLGYNVPSLATLEDPWEAYALRMLAGVLDEGYSARFESELVRGAEIAVSAGVSYSPFSRGDTLLVVSGIPNTARGADSQDLEAAFLEQITRLQNSPPDQHELARIRAQVVSGLIFHQDSLSAQANLIGSLESIGLGWQLIDQYVAHLESITPQQIQQVAKKYLIAENLTVAELVPSAGTGKEED